MNLRNIWRALLPWKRLDRDLERQLEYDSIDGDVFGEQISQVSHRSLVGKVWKVWDLRDGDVVASAEEGDKKFYREVFLPMSEALTPEGQENLPYFWALRKDGGETRVSLSADAVLEALRQKRSECKYCEATCGRCDGP